MKYGSIITNLTLWNPSAYVTDMSRYKNTGYMDHGLEYITFVQKCTASLAVCSASPAGSQRADRGARLCEICLLLITWWHKWPGHIVNPETDLVCLEYSDLTHWGRDKMDAISQMTLSNAFSWMKMLEFRLTFHPGHYLVDPYTWS